MKRSAGHLLKLPALLCVTALLAAGCTGQRSTASSTGRSVTGNATSLTSAICSILLPELDALWDPNRDGTGGFGDAPTLAAAPSLYYTAWSVRLADAAHVKLANLDEVVTATALIASALSSRAADEDVRIPMAERLHLAAEALHALQIPIPDTMLNALDTLRSGGQYRGDRASSVGDWSATYLAAQTLALAGRRIPTEATNMARTVLPTAKRAGSPQAILSFGIPVLGTLSATPGLLPKLVPDMATVLSSFTTSLLSAGGASGITAAALVSVADIAAAAGITPPTVPSDFLTPLITPTGYYSIGQGKQQHGDAQVTYYAVRLGARLSDLAKSALKTGQVKQGWLATLSPATLTSSYQAIVAVSACGSALPHRDTFKILIPRWLSDASAPPVAGGVLRPGGGNGSASDVGEVCWLSQAYGLTITDAQREALADAISRAATQASDSASGIPPAGEVAAAVKQCHLRLAEDTRGALIRHLATVTAATAVDALTLHLASAVLSAPQLDIRAREIATKLKTPAGLFRFQAVAGNPDLLSTAYGYAAGGGNPADAAAAEAKFATPWGPGLALPDSSGVTAPMVNLVSLAAGLMLLTTGSGTPLLY